MTTAVQRMYGFVTCASLLFVTAICAQQYSLPPSIVEGPRNIIRTIPRGSNPAIIPCVFTGSPRPDVTWQLNGVPLNLNLPYITLDQTQQTGNITITPTSDQHYGYYQCIVSNEFGKALSNITLVTEAILSSFTKGLVVNTRASVGQYLSLPCNAPKSVPASRFTWAIAEYNNDESTAGTQLNLDQRLQIDDKGNLHFAYMTMEDSRSSPNVYKCQMYNNVLDSMVAGSMNQLTIATATPAASAPVLRFSSSTVMTAYEGGNVTLRCFFAAYSTNQPLVTYSWSFDRGPLQHHEILLKGPQLQLTNVMMSMGGVYTCRGSNDAGSASVDFTLNVLVPPVFFPIQTGPYDRNVTTNDTVTFSCNARAIPNATNVVWFKNGTPLNFNSLPPKFSMSGNTLTIRNVCKLCPDQTRDLMVIQCNASNGLGYAYRGGYINVLDPTVIGTVPADVFYDPGKDAVFQVSATSDPSTPVTYTWYKDGNQLSQTQDKVSVSSDGTLTIKSMNEDDIGEYKCVASNGVSSTSHAARLYDPARVAGAQIWKYWWIPLIIILIILIILLIILICCCLKYRNRGEEYPVHEKEIKQGNDPEKELKDTGFHDYQRPEGAPVLKDRRPSMSSSIGKPASDDEMSLNDYGLNPGKFNEDGSFIGQYYTKDNTRRKPAPPPAYEAQV